MIMKKNKNKTLFSFIIHNLIVPLQTEVETKTFFVILLTVLGYIHVFGHNDYDMDKPFGYCTLSHCNDATQTFDIRGGGCYSYPIPEDFGGKVIVLQSTGNDMRNEIESAINDNQVIVFDGSKGDFIVSSSIFLQNVSDKTLLGINKARLCTKWFVTAELKETLDAAGVPAMSTSRGGGVLPNGMRVREEAEYHTRRIIMELTGDKDEVYRQSGIMTLNDCQNIIIRNISFVGPGSIDVGGSDLLSFVHGTKNCWVDHCSFADGMDGNFDITTKSDFLTVSWCTFSYTNRSYMHQNTNLVGYSDNETTGFLCTTFAFNWWGEGCKARMPMARAAKVHLLNNYYTSTKAINCINPRKNSEFLIEGNYIDKGVRNYYSQTDAIAVEWRSDNFIAEADNLPASFGGPLEIPYFYSVAPCSEVPEVVKENAGATLKSITDNQ